MCNDFILRNVQNEELSYGEATGTEPTLLTSTGHILYLEGEKLQTLSLMFNFEEAAVHASLQPVTQLTHVK